jgi:hypothetical protein
MVNRLGPKGCRTDRAADSGDRTQTDPRRTDAGANVRTAAATVAVAAVGPSFSPVPSFS